MGKTLHNQFDESCYKVRIVSNIIRGRTLHEIALEQYGFMPDKGTGNAIFVLRMLVERSIEKQKYVYVCFNGNSKAFDTIKYKVWVDLLQSLDIDLAELRLLTSLYLNQTVAVRCDDGISAWMRTRSTTRACGFSTFIFLVYRNDYEGIRRYGGFQN